MQTTANPYAIVTAQMSLAREAIALELSVGTSQRALGFLPSFFGSVTDGLKAFISRKFDFYKADHLRVEEDKILKKLADVNFATVAPLQVTGLEGLEGTYLDYGKLILSSFDYYENTTAKELVAYRRILGDLLTNPGSERRLEVKTNLKKTDKEIKDLDASIGQLFGRGSHIAVTTVDKLVSRYADLPVVFADSQAVVAKIKELNPDKIKGLVTEINDLVELVIKDIEANKLNAISSSQLTNLSEGIMALAKQVEFFGLTYYRAVTYCAGVERLVEVLKKA